MLSPVAIFVYNRPEHTKKTIDALSKNDLADQTDVFIYSDAAKREKDIENVNLVRDYIESVPNSKSFKSVKIIKSKTNNGLAKSVLSGVNNIIKEYGKVIVVEDDLISSTDFLQYMNDALDFYKDNKKIWSISGYTFKFDYPKNYKHDVYLSYRGCSWGWATWEDRWENIDWDVKDYAEFKNSKNLRNKFNRGGRDMANMLDLQMKGKIDSWAIRWCYAQSKLDMLTVYPIVSRIKNIGLDGTGTHSGVTTKFDTDFNENTQKCQFENLEIDHRIVKKFQDYYGTAFDYFIIGIKRVIKKIFRIS
ncbi:glycosyltransferase [Neobacillus mesonae]|uniref:glycosyltransferase n=1 Tax=Neobacillus mesonae TaxID=1193713 RepID=UPI0025728724|nr:glycosyltransferase [Neobacillus mesonae]